MYERLVDVLGGETDEPYATARQVLEALQEPTSEVLALGGIAAETWRAAVGAMLARADEVDQQLLEAEAEERRAAWPAVRRQLETLGCQLWRLVDNQDAWRIEAPGVYIEVDLASGEIDEHDLFYETDPWAKLPEVVARQIKRKRLQLAEDARKEALRRTHTWDNRRKGWVPNNGNGPIIKGGGASPKAPEPV